MDQRLLEQQLPHVRPRPKSRERAVWLRGLQRVAPVAGYLVPPAIALVLLGVAWELWTRISGTPVYIVPAPSEVLQRLFGDLGFFPREGAVTLYEALAGFGRVEPGTG